MEKESFLGIKRVEALLKIVDEKRKDELSKVAPLSNEVDYQSKLEDIKKYFNSSEFDIEEVFGRFKNSCSELVDAGVETHHIRNANNYDIWDLYTSVPEVNRGQSLAKAEHQEKLDNINSKYAAIHSKLWLCTSVAEAQEIMEEL